MKRWDRYTGTEVEDKKIDAFLDEIIKVSKRHGFSISHEDSQGSFLIERFNKDDTNWLCHAHIPRKRELR